MKFYKAMLIFTLMLTAFLQAATAQKGDHENSSTLQASREYVFMADPFVLKHEGKYYLYGTRRARRGIQVYTSTDLDNWKGPAGATNGFALSTGDSYGDKAYMGAYIVKKQSKFYFYYVATGKPQIAVAIGDSPLGPFIQEKKAPLNIEGKSIAPHVFTDDDGKSYMYFTKLDHGNKIYVAEMNDDLLSVKKHTVKECIRVTEPWEHTEKNPNSKWPVAEGAAVLKHKGVYYLFYTANHYKNPDYNVGYATSSSPLGPWTKHEGNPIIEQSTNAVGVGSGEFIRNESGELLFFYHAHNNRKRVSPRKVVYSKVEFVPAKNGVLDIVKVSDKKYFPQISAY